MAAPARESPRVYIVDDDPAVLDSTALLLRTFGYHCETFADAEVFLEQSERLGAGCILTDLRMPGMNGCRLRAELRARSISWPILLMSGDNGHDAEVRARAHGFAAFLRKPLDGEALASALDTACAVLSREGR